MADFYMKRGDQQFGPYKASRLKQHADDGRVLPSDLIRQGEEGKWYPASSVKGLFSKESVRQSADAQDATSELDPEAEDEAMALLMQSTDVSVVAPSAATAQDTSPSSTPTEPPQPADTNPNLRACPDCEKMVSKRAAACPSCGAPLEPPQPSEPSVNEQVVQQVFDQPVDEETVNLNRDARDYAQQEETVYFSENFKGAGQVQVTSSRVILPTQVYPLSNIASVRWGADGRMRVLPKITMLVGFTLCLGFLVGAFLFPFVDGGTNLKYNSAAVVSFFVSIGFGIVGVFGYRALQKAKEYFYLWVGTSGAETKNLGGTDPQLFRRLVDSINKVIVDRGGH